LSSSPSSSTSMPVAPLPSSLLLSSSSVIVGRCRCRLLP
jgi:hypothetical protein